MMLTATLLVQWRAEAMVRAFTSDPAVIAVAAQYLRIISWNFVAVGLTFTCSGLFQALGNTWPSLASKAVRLVTFVLPAIWLSRRAAFELTDVWYVSLASTLLEAAVCFALLHLEFRERLGTEKALGNPPDGIPATKARS